jgi:hypothetical protein
VSVRRLFPFSASGVCPALSRVDEARQAIAAEFPAGLGPWEPVPTDAADPHEYAVRYARAKFGAPEA